ncbi:MAG: phosphoribosylanthranilate isomerase [Luteolibacter sp.]
MMLSDSFFDPARTSLKICGVTTRGDAERLVALGVPALGVNFWPMSKRHVDPASAAWLRDLTGRILRVGVFVNQAAELPLRLVEEGMLDVVQLHGDETPEDARFFRAAGVPFIKAIGVAGRGELERAADFGARAILLDAHAPGVYGGTGETFDWNAALAFKQQHPEIPLMLAGGITPENAADAAATVRPAALDVASGAEVSPGVKDFTKVAALLRAVCQP